MPDQVAKGIATHPLFPRSHRACIACEYRSRVVLDFGVTEQARNRLYLFAHCACDRGRPSAHKFRTQRAAASTRGIWHCRRSLYASCGLKLSGRCIPHFGKRRRLTIRPITTAATRRREFAYPDDKPEPNRLWRPRVKVKDCRPTGMHGPPLRRKRNVRMSQVGLRKCIRPLLE